MPFREIQDWRSEITILDNMGQLLYISLSPVETRSCESKAAKPLELLSVGSQLRTSSQNHVRRYTLLDDGIL